MAATLKPKRAALYLRVSTDRQTVENQSKALEAIAAHRGWEVVTTYSDKGISGSKGRKDRPEFDQMLSDAGRGKFDVVMAFALDRAAARSETYSTRSATWKAAKWTCS